MSDDPKYLEQHHEELEPWHRHSVGEGAPQQEHLAHVSIPALIVTFFGLGGFVAAAVTFAIIYFHQDIYGRQKAYENTEWREEISLPYREQSLRSIETTTWENEGEGLVRVPIDLAMDRVVERYRGGSDVFVAPAADAGGSDE